jgi:hypothetical protein
VQTGAVFLSYASGDAVAAERICTSLRAGGIEVWLDQSELRGGDAWDHERLDSLGMGKRHPHTDRAAVVLHKKHVSVDVELFEQRAHRLGEVVKGVAVAGRRRRLALAEAGIVRGDQMVTVCEQFHQGSVHPRRRWIAVQRHDYRRVFRRCLEVAQVYAGNARVAGGYAGEGGRHVGGLCSWIIDPQMNDHARLRVADSPGQQFWPPLKRPITNG